MDNLSTRQQEQLSQFAGLIRLWNSKINLVAPKTLATLEERHIADSAQLAPYLPTIPHALLDVGSGAGLPGVVLAVLRPDVAVTLAERDQRKAAFLHTVVHQLGLANAQVFGGDVNVLARQKPAAFQAVTCRAWAGLPDILSQTTPLLAPQGYWLLLKGRAVDAELEACGTSFHFTKELWPSKLQNDDGERGWVLKITPATELPVEL